MKSSSTGSDSSPFMKVKEELLRQRKKRRIRTRRKEKREIKVRKKVKKGSKEDNVAHQEGKKESDKQQTSRPQRALTIMGTSGILHHHSGLNLTIMMSMLWR